MRVLVIDFFDSFTYNIAHYLEGLNVEVDVIKDGNLNLDSIEQFDALILSPGPGLPNEKKQLREVLERFAASKKILGICLGMQALSEYFGGSLRNQKIVKHGVSESINVIEKSKLYDGIPQQFKVGLYHSWEVKVEQTKDLKVTAISNENVIMSVEHKTLQIYGVQFHPESILSEYGKEILSNFLFKIK